MVVPPLLGLCEEYANEVVGGGEGRWVVFRGCGEVSDSVGLHLCQCGLSGSAFAADELKQLGWDRISAVAYNLFR